MEEFKKKLIQLLHYPNVSWNKVYQLLKKDPNLVTINKHLRPKDFPQGSNSTEFPINQSSSFQLQQIHEQIQQYPMDKINVITIFDKEYPPLLKKIYQPPWALFVKGDLSLLKKDPKLAVVGSRMATIYGKNAIYRLFPGMIEKGIVIVSGLAKGIDTFAHECAIKNGGKTIAVIAGGLYHIFPKENINLALEMMETQLIISEYPPNTRPQKWQFPARNRIISGLSIGTFVIEAKQKSGSLITANYALNEGREVFSLPGSIFSPFSTGTNELIQQGAKLVMKPEDIFEEIRL